MKGLRRAALLMTGLGLCSNYCFADSADLAREVLRLGGTGQTIDKAVAQQAEKFTSELSVMMREKHSVELPVSTSEEIAQCFTANGTWGAIENDVVNAYAGSLTDNELGLLLSYYQNLEIPPAQANAFKSMQKKMPELQKQLENIMRDVQLKCANKAEELVNQLVSDQG